MKLFKYLATLLLFAATAFTQTVPELPRVYVNTGLQTLPGPVINVGAGANLQAILDSATPGSIIKLQSGVTFRGNFKLSPKANYVYVTSSSFNGKPGNRVFPTDAARMAKIVTGNASPAIQSLPLASNWRFIGIEITNARTDLDVTNLVNLQPTTRPATVADQPKNIIFDRCYIYGTGTRVRRGVRFGGSHQAVIDSYIANIRQHGFDTQTISDSQGTGPYKIVNNYLEASSENVAFGGSNPWFKGLPPSDIEVVGNYMYKPLAWKDQQKDELGRDMLVKNSFELKSGVRVLVKGNVMENNWVDAQVGFAVVITPTYFSNLVNPDGTPMHAISDVTFIYNKIINTDSALNVLGTGILNGGYRSPSIRQRYSHNIWQVNAAYRHFQLINNPNEVEISNNRLDMPITCKGTPLFIGGTTTNQMTIRENVMPWCSYGVWTTRTLTSQADYEATFPPAETLPMRFFGNFFYGVKKPFLPAGNTWLTDPATAPVVVDVKGLEEATAHAIDGRTYVYKTFAMPEELLDEILLYFQEDSELRKKLESIGQ